jgi:hypothetical protein
MPGVYTENLTLSNLNVSIIGSGSFPGEQQNTTIIGNHTFTNTTGTNSILFQGLTLANPTASTSLIDMSGSPSIVPTLTISSCVIGDSGANTITNYINSVGNGKITIERTTMTSGTQTHTAPLIFCSGAMATISLCNLSTATNQPVLKIAGTNNSLTLSYSQLACSSATSSALGVIQLSSTGSLVLHSIVNCGINSSASATGTGNANGGTPAVGLDATGTGLIFFSNVCLTRLYASGNSLADCVAFTGSGTSGTTTTTYSSGNGTVYNGYAHGVVSGSVSVGGGTATFVKTAMTTIP